MNHMRLFLFFSFLFILSSCQVGKDNGIAKAWIFDDEVNNKLGNDLIKTGLKVDNYLTGANFIDLRGDGTYSMYFNEFESGKWKVKDQHLLLINDDRKIKEFAIYRQKGNELVLIDKMKGKMFPFSGWSNEFSKKEDDPFINANNRWRVKAAHKESDKELAARLKNHFTFWQKYFDWGDKHTIDYLDVRNTPTLVKLYGNGFELEYYDNLLPEWKNTFYDTTDCRIAYEMLYYKMYEKNVQWPKTDSRYKSLASAFGQLQQWMDEKPSPYVKRKR